MRVFYNQNEIGRIDKRFSEWDLTAGKDARVRKSKSYAKSKRNKKFANFKAELRKTAILVIVLALVTGFIYIRLAAK